MDKHMGVYLYQYRDNVLHIIDTYVLIYYQFEYKVSFFQFFPNLPLVSTRKSNVTDFRKNKE